MEKEIREHENENTTQVSLLGRKYQSVFVTSFMSERGDKPTNNCYISYIELDNFGCWVVVDGNNGGIFQNKIASYIGETIVENFIANPTIAKREIEKMLLSIHKKYRNMQSEEVNIEDDYSTCSIAMFVTDYAVATFASVGNARYGVLRNHKLVKKSNDDTLAYLQYEAGNILYDEIRFRKDKNIFTKRFGADRSIKINVSDIFVLRPNDRVLLYTQGAWENLDEEDIELISEKAERPGKFIGNLVNKMKRNCFLSLGNYTFCGIYINRPLDVPAPPESSISKLKTQISKNKNSLKKKILVILALLILIGGGVPAYQKIKLNNRINSIEKEIAFNLEKGRVEVQEKDYSEATTNYQKIKDLYTELKTYKEVPDEKLKEIDSILAEIQILNRVQTLSKLREDSLESYKFNEAVKSYEEENKPKPVTPKKQEPKKIAKLPAYKGDREFREFRYYDSLKSYENALKGANTPEKKEYLKGKIAMNKQLLIAVELELKGDEYLEKRKDSKKVKKYYEDALVENKKLVNNNYMPKDRYNVIINRLENKLKKLK